jgi:hypothetical protein
MPRGFSSVSVNVAGKTITCDYTWHLYTERNGPRDASQTFLEWEPVGVYLNDTPTTLAEIKKISPNIDTILDEAIQEQH